MAVGAEFKLGAHWSVVGEYLFTSIDDRGESTVRSQGPAPATNPFILVSAAGTDLQRTEKFAFSGSADRRELPLLTDGALAQVGPLRSRSALACRWARI